ncbi:MAG: peptidoglycan-binding domain-containing protein [Fidelibacterota bacterium]
MKILLLLLSVFLIGCSSNSQNNRPDIENHQGENLVLGTNREKVIKPEELTRVSESEFHNKRFTKEERMILKNMLLILGYDVNTTTDLWDEKTEQAIMEFQKEHLLTPTGIVDKETLWKLANVIRKAKMITITPDEAGKKKAIPFNYPFWYGYLKNKQINPGDILKYFDYKSGKFKYAEVESITGNEVRLYDYEKDEYYYIDIDDIE